VEAAQSDYVKARSISHLDRKRRTGSAYAALIKRRPSGYMICRRPVVAAPILTACPSCSVCVLQLLPVVLVKLPYSGAVVPLHTSP
jgi:hypothetical protein